MSGSKPVFYDGTKLLGSKDRDGLDPELYICYSRVRGPGKTFFFTKKLMDAFMDGRGKFVLLVRTRAMVGSVADGQFRGMLQVHYPGTTMYEKKRMNGTYSDIYIRTVVDDAPVDTHCGFVVPINAADVIKTISSKFVDAIHAFYDEFMPEDKTTYLPREVQKFLSVHTSLARGGGESRRYYPVYMASNMVSITNPYFTHLNVTNKIQDNTKFYRGRGFVIERTVNKGLVEKHANTGMARAFSGVESINYGDSTWLNDSKAGITKPGNDWGAFLYGCTIIAPGKSYSLKYYTNVQLWYMSHSVDMTHPNVYRVEVDGESNLPLLKNSDPGRLMRTAMEQGTMRFQDQTAKALAIEIVF